jgi:hypothetical protein
MMIRPEIEQTDRRELFAISDSVTFGYEVKQIIFWTAKILRAKVNAARWQDESISRFHHKLWEAI